MPIVLECGSLDLLELSGPVQACGGIALPLLTFANEFLFALERLQNKCERLPSMAENPGARKTDRVRKNFWR